MLQFFFKKSNIVTFSLLKFNEKFVKVPTLMSINSDENMSQIKIFKL